MRGRHRVVRTTCAVGVAGLALVPFAARALSPPAAPLPLAFGGVASVSGLYEHLDSTPGVAPTSEPVFASFADGNSTYSPQTLYARSAPYYPGDTVNGLSGLLCTAGLPPACNAPPLPLTATANQQTPDASVSLVPAVVPGASVPFSATAFRGEAHAHAETGVSTTAVVTGVDESTAAGAAATRIQSLRSELAAILGHSVGAGSASLLSIGTISGTTSQAFTNGVLHVHAEVQDSGINLLGGVLHIGSVTAVSDTTSDGQSKPKHTDTAQATGVTVAGLAAAIDQNGITINGAGVPSAVVKGVADALNKTLVGLGASVQFLGHSSGAAVLQPGTCTNGEADGLQIHVSADLRSVPVEGALFYDDIAIGAACTTASVGAADVTNSTPATAVPGAAGGGDSGSSAGTPGVPGSSAVGVSQAPGSPDAGTAPTPVALGPGTARPTGLFPSLEALLGTDRLTDSFAFLYLAFVVTAVAFLVGATPFFQPRHRREKGARGA